MSLVSRHLRRRRARLTISYSLTVVENLFELLYPFAIGLSVNGLLDDSWSGVAVLVAITLAHVAVGAGRQIFDTRSFNRLYADMASELVESQRRDSVETSSVAARTVLAGDYVEFLEVDVGAAIAAAFAVFGSLLMLFLYDPLIGAAASVLLVPVALVNLWLLRRSGRIHRDANDVSEQEVSVIERGRAVETRRHFRVLAGHWNRLSDTEAISWVLVELLAVGSRGVDAGAGDRWRKRHRCDLRDDRLRLVLHRWLRRRAGGRAADVEPSRHPTSTRSGDLGAAERPDRPGVTVAVVRPERWWVRPRRCSFLRRRRPSSARRPSGTAGSRRPPRGCRRRHRRRSRPQRMRGLRWCPAG